MNVNSQIEKMKELSKKELYLLLITVLDKFQDDDPMVIKNDTDVIYHNNQKLPEPRDKSGVRDAKIDIIIK